MKTPLITTLTIPIPANIAPILPTTGKLVVSTNNLTYLNITDEYIHQLFPLLPFNQIKKPDYFGKGGAGAHISVIYTDENIKINNTDLNKEHHFVIQDIVLAQLDQKKYFVLLVDAPSLLNIRRKYGLPDLLCFKGYAIGFHITLAIGSNIKH